MNFPRSSRFAYSDSPTPSCQRIFARSPLRPGRCKDRRRADRASTAPEPEAQLPACRDACRCGPSQSTPAPPAWHRDHRSPRTLRTRRSASASTSLSTRTRFPEPSSISMTPDPVRRPPGAARDRLAVSNKGGGAVASISTGSKIELSLPIGSVVRACRRQVKSRLCATRAAARLAHHAPRASVSSTIRAFSSLLPRRRRSIPRTFPSISA